MEISGEEVEMDMVLGSTDLPLSIEGVLRRVATAHKVVVIAAQWPSWLVTMIALDIPI